MQNLTDLANQALLRIGERPIDNVLQDDSDVPRRVRMVLGTTLREVQAAFPWRELVHAATNSTLVREPELAEDEWLAYRLPPGFLTLVPPEWPYRLERGRLLTPMEAFTLYFVRLDETAANWSPALYRCCYLLLASNLAATLAQNHDLATAMRREYDVELDRATARQSFENRPKSYRRRGESIYTREHRR